MYITITFIRLKSLWKFFSLSAWGLSISRQAKKQKGFVKMKNTGFGYMHYTMTAWETEEDMKNFAYKQGSHADAMKQSAKLATEIGNYTLQADALPDWKTAKELIHAKGRVVKF